MFLQKLVISGFKSYAREASVDFKSGIAVIIGNNGVGKSNILDAIAWALGEKNLSRLRCGTDEDLFFSGTEKDVPAQTARVDLHLKCKEEDEMTVIISRQRDRQGIDSYFVDGSPVEEQGYAQKLAALAMTDTVKTLVRQEEINNFIHLSSEERYTYLGYLLNTSEITNEILSAINSHFNYYFKLLIPEGDAELSWAKSNGLALKVSAAFKGKSMRDSIQLSGGEKTVCSLSLLLSIFEMLQSPFYLLDEVEPSLDWTNHHQMQTFLKILAAKRQLIIITHLRSTIELADTLHGIRAGRDGTSFVKFYFEMDDRLLRAYSCVC